MISSRFYKILYTCLLGSGIIVFSPHSYAKHILVFGDSLSAAYGMELEQGWVSLLDTALGDEHRISNASISGETTGGGLARLPLALSEFKPDLVIIELGGNDGLRGQTTQRMQENLEQMIKLVEDSGAEAVLASISIPPSYGPRYIDAFRKVFTDLAQEHKLPVIDLYREDFYNTEGYIQADGLHPTPITQPIIRDLFLDFFSENKLLAKTPTSLNPTIDPTLEPE